MNNLKKVLALGLALVMLLGMFTIASAAKETKMVASDLTDWASVEHKDAVALMVDLGIIKGKDSGAFDPTATITRAEWAKMVYVAANGDDNADAFLTSGTALTDIKGNWAESYIKALYAKKTLSGDGMGNFSPDRDVTVAEACKMMLTTLKYDAEASGYQNNADWQGNIMTDAKRVGLMNNVDREQSADKPLTRENAAEIVYNAMQANTVKPSVQWDGGVRHVEDYTKIGTLGYDVFGIIRVDAVVNSITNGYANFDQETYYADGSVCTGVKGGQLKDIKASADVIGQTVSVFVEVKNLNVDPNKGELTGAQFLDVVSTTVARTGAGADYTFKGGFNWTNVTTASKDEYVADKFSTEAKFYYNGNLQADKTAFENKVKPYIWDTSDASPIPGIIVEFYLNNEGEIKTVKAYDHSVAQLSGDVETRTSNGVLQVKVPGVVNTWTDAVKVSGYQGLAEDDVVLYYITGTQDNKTYVIEKAEKVTGKVTGWSNTNTITVNGTKYKRTGLTTVDASLTEGFGLTGKTFADWTDRENEYNFFLDKSGSICFIEKVTDAAVKDKIALVLAAEWTATNLDTANGTLRAKLLFIDGTTQVVTVSKLDSKRVVTTKSSNPNTAANEIVGGRETADDTDPADSAIVALNAAKVANADLKDSKFFNYRVVDGKYELTTVVNTTADDAKYGWTDTESFKDAKVEKVAGFTSTASYSADSKTTFLVAKGEAGEEQYYTYTGFKNVPEMANANGLAVGTVDANGVAKYVYLSTVSYSDEVPEGYVFLYNKNFASDDNNPDENSVINVVDQTGNITTLTVTNSLRDELLNTAKVSSVSDWKDPNNAVGNFFRIDSIDEKGVVSKMTAVADLSSMANVTAMGNDVIRADGKICSSELDADTMTSVDYDNVTKFVYIDLAVSDGNVEGTIEGDTLVFADAGTFNPENFFRKDAVEDEPQAGLRPIDQAEKAYDSVQVTAIHAENSTTADYVYVVRVCW